MSDGHSIKVDEKELAMISSKVPVITSLKDADGVELGGGASTSRLPVTIDGLASSSDFIEVHDTDGLVGKVFAGVSGLWSFHLLPSSIGEHRVFAKSKAGKSAVKTFEVVAVK